MGIKCPERGDCIHGNRCLTNARCIDPFQVQTEEKAILDAVFNEGSHPIFHQKALAELRDTWPVLYRALMALASSERAHDYLMHTWPETASSFFARRNAGVHTSVPHLRKPSPGEGT